MPTRAPHSLKPANLSAGRRRAPERGGRALVAVLAVVLVALLCATIGGLLWAFRPAPTAVAPPGQEARDATAVFERAEKAFRENDDERCAALCREGVVSFPADQRIRITYAKALTALKKPTEAYEQISAALAIGPTTDPDLHALAGSLGSAAGKPERAIEHFSEAQRLAPGNARHPLFLAMAQIKAGQDTAAMATLLRVIKLDDSVAEAWGTLAELNLKAQNPAPAIEQARRARQLQPTVVRWRLREATALKRDGQPEAALALLTALSEEERNADDVLSTIADCCGLMKRPEIAAAEFARAARVRELGGADALVLGRLHAQAAAWFRRGGDEVSAQTHERRAAELGFVEGPGPGG